MSTQSSPLGIIGAVIGPLIGILKRGEHGQKRRNIAVAKKTLKALKKEYKKNDGKIDADEKADLDALQDAINEASVNLIKNNN